MLDGSLAIKNAQKQAQARESVAAGSRHETSGTRFSAFVDDARESEDDRAARIAQAGEQAERIQATQMRARKGADAGKTLVSQGPAEAPRAKVPADADKEAKALPQTDEPSAPPTNKAEAAEPVRQAKDKGAADKAEPVEKAETSETSDEASDEEVKSEAVSEAANLVASKVETPQPVPVVIAAQTAASEPQVATEAEQVEALGDVTGSTKPAAQIALPGAETDGVTQELTPEQLADAAKIARATQKETPKPALATATMASEEAIPDVLQALTPQGEPKPVPQVKVKAETADQTPKADAKLADVDAAAPTVSVKGDAVQAVTTSKPETDKSGSTVAADASVVDSPKEPSLRADSAAVSSSNAPQAQVAPAQQQDVAAPLPDPNLVPTSDGSRLSPTPSTQQAAPSAATLTSGPLVPLNQVAVSIATKAMGGSTRFDIRLDPPELGRIDVRLTMDREGRVKSTMVIEKRETYELMQRDQRGLETAMQQAGLKMNEGSVEFTLRDPSSNGQQNNAGNLFGDREGRSGQRPVLDDPRAEQGTSETTTIQMYASLAQQRGGVDLRI